MKLNRFENPKSSFLGMSKDTALIMQRVLENTNLLKLIYYADRDYASKPNLTPDQKKELFDKGYISCLPQITIDEDIKTYLRFNYDAFTPDATNPFYRDHILEVKIICHFSAWDLGNFELRPYRIAGEIDSMLDNAKLTGIGEFIFLGADQDVYDQEFAGVTLRYLATRGNEDKQWPLNET